MSKHSTRACLIVNARSRRAVAIVSDALPILRAQGWRVEVRQKHHKGEAAKLAAVAVGEGFDVVIACGGDGTVSEVVDGVAGTDLAVGTLPGGTANVWAHEIGVSMRPQVAAMQLAVSERLRIDVGRVKVNGHHGRHFLLMAGLGLDGAIMQRVSRSLKNRIGPLAVGVAAAEALPSFRAVPVRAELDGAHWQGKVAQIVIGNTRLYGGFTKLTPDAYIDDGVLDVCFITPGGLMGTTRQAASLLFRRHPSEESAELYRAAEVTIHAPQEMPFQLDGGAVHQKHEKLGADGLVYEFSAVPQAVTVLVPRTYDRDLLQRGVPGAMEDGRSRKKRKGKRNKDH
ncbi:MAG TPA: diacylglycerol kinase family protein [Chloroflexota bacterium]